MKYQNDKQIYYENGHNLKQHNLSFKPKLLKSKKMINSFKREKRN